MADALVLGTSSNGVRVRPPLLRKIKNDPKHGLGAIFYAGEGGRTARLPDGSYHDMDK